MTKPYEGYDGIERDIRRMAYEGRLVAAALTTTIKEFVTLKGGWRDIGHNYVDIFNEPLKGTSFFWAHILCWIPPALILRAVL